MYMQDLIKEIEHNDEMCQYCIYCSNCPGMTCVGEPIYPPCANIEYQELFDFDKYLDDNTDDGEPYYS